MVGLSVPVAAGFSVMFGVSNGLITIARGTVPLALFGPAGFAALVGWLGAPWLVVQAAAPRLVALVIEHGFAAAALAVTAIFAVVALGCIPALRRPAG